MLQVPHKEVLPIIKTDVLPSNKAFNTLAYFSRFLGFPIKGFKEEIWCLLRKMEAKIGYGASNTGLKKNKSPISWFERDLQRLNCSVNYGAFVKVVRRDRKIN